MLAAQMRRHFVVDGFLQADSGEITNVIEQQTAVAR